MTVRFTGSTLGNYIARVYKPDGVYFTSKLALGANTNMTLAPLPTTGTYTVVIDPPGSNTGSVTVAVTNP